MAIIGTSIYRGKSYQVANASFDVGMGYGMQRFKEIGFAGAVFADKNIDEANAVETQCEVFEVFVVADGDGFQAHELLR